MSWWSKKVKKYAGTALGIVGGAVLGAVVVIIWLLIVDVTEDIIIGEEFYNVNGFIYDGIGLANLDLISYTDNFKEYVIQIKKIRRNHFNLL